MIWAPFADGLRLDPLAEGPPEALVVMLQDFHAGASALLPVAARWAEMVPTTAFTVLDGATSARDRTGRHLRAILDRQLGARELNASRLVLVGFGRAGGFVLDMVLREDWRCVGVLAVATELKQPLPQPHSIDRKIRLIECVGDAAIDHSRLRAVVEALAALGIDTRGVVLAGSNLSEAVIRHGGAYLVELVATAQRGHRLPFEPVGAGAP